MKKIVGELTKLAINLEKTTVRNILKKFREQGKINSSLTWRKFLKMQIGSIYAMDFFTIDTFLNKRYYVYFIISHQTREIVQFAITENPIREFVRQQIIEFTYSLENTVYMIHDNALEFSLDYLSYGIKEVRTSVESPNMNAIAERFVRTIRNECLDWFLLFSRKQIYKLIREFIHYYNCQRTHQGRNYAVPKGYAPQENGKIMSIPILNGLFRHYFRVLPCQI